MRIVIDIDDNLYARLFDNGIDNYDDAVDMAKVIRKGTILQNGCGRLIDADKLRISDFELIMCNGNYKMALEILCQKIENAQTILKPEV